jgi:hypothetical protein
MSFVHAEVRAPALSGKIALQDKIAVQNLICRGLSPFTVMKPAFSRDIGATLPMLAFPPTVRLIKFGVPTER